MVRSAAAAALALLFAGCNSPNPQLTGAEVAGTVKYKGKVVTGGEIQFVNPADPNKSQSGKIYGDGTFDVPNVPVGEVVVVVDTEMARYDVSAMHAQHKTGDKGAAPNPNAKPPSKFMEVDKKYASHKTSPLKMTVVAGKNQKDFDLE